MALTWYSRLVATRRHGDSIHVVQPQCDGIHDDLTPPLRDTTEKGVIVMSAQEEQAKQPPKPPLKALFPAPPPFYKYFTKPNIAELKRLREQAGPPPDGKQTEQDGSSIKPDLDILSLPTELRFLIPPPPPTDGKFQSFGICHNPNGPPPSLQDLQVEQLYPSHPGVKLNPQTYLISLAKSQLLTFLGLVGALSQNAEKYDTFTRDLETITSNMHDLVNQYRPHQARESLISMMKERVEKMRAEIKAIAEAKARARKLMEALRDDEERLLRAEAMTAREDPGSRRKDVDPVSRRKARQRAAWAAIEEACAEYDH